MARRGIVDRFWKQERTGGVRSLRHDFVIQTPSVVDATRANREHHGYSIAQVTARFHSGISEGIKARRSTQEREGAGPP